MKKTLTLILAMAVIASSAFAATYKSSDGKVSFTAPSIEFGNYKITAKAPHRWTLPTRAKAWL